MKNVYIVNWDSNNKVGGTNTFDRVLTKALENNFTIHNVYIKQRHHGEMVSNSPIKYFPFIGKNWRELKKLKGQTIVFNSFWQLWWFPKKALKNNRVILQQHFSSSRLKKVWGRWWKRPFVLAMARHIDDLALFGKSEYVNLQNMFKSCRVHGRPHCAASPEIGKVEKIDKFVYIGRIEKFQKRVFRLAKLCEENKVDVDFYGYGKKIEEFKKYVENFDHITFNGKLAKEEVIPTFAKYKANIMGSDFEGYPYTIVESASANTPTLTSNSFDMAKTIFCESDMGYLFEDVKELAQKANSLNFKGLNPRRVFDENWSEQSFANDWIDIVNLVK